MFGMQLLPVTALPLPGLKLIELAVESAEDIHLCIDRIGKQIRAGPGWRRMLRLRFVPLRSRSVPNPGIAEVLVSIVTAEEDDSMGNGIVRHLRAGSRSRGSVREQSLPSLTVESPSVAQMLRSVITAEDDDPLAVRIVGHREIAARCRRNRRMQLHPIGRLLRGGGGFEVGFAAKCALRRESIHRRERNNAATNDRARSNKR